MISLWCGLLDGREAWIGGSVHELAMCDSIAKAACRSADGRRVRVIQMRIGALRQVVPETLTYCWELVDRGPLLAGCVLDVEFVPAEVECNSCGARIVLGSAWCCPACGGSAVHVVAGDEMVITGIDVEEDGLDGERPAGPV